MTNKDYELITKAISRVTTGGPEPGATDVIIALCNALADDNPRFDRAKFLRACGEVPK